MNQINWCLKRKNGIKIIEPNINLAMAYIIKAEESLETSRLARSKDWKISAAYYTLYFSLYSILMRLGIKCEIHKCTIDFANEFLKKYFSHTQLCLLQEAFDARQDAQYYVNKEVKNDIYIKLLEECPFFISYCKEVLLKFNEDEIEQIRKHLKLYLTDN